MSEYRWGRSTIPISINLNLNWNLWFVENWVLFSTTPSIHHWPSVCISEISQVRIIIFDTHSSQKLQFLFWRMFICQLASMPKWIIVNGIYILVKLMFLSLYLNWNLLKTSTNTSNSVNDKVIRFESYKTDFRMRKNFPTLFIILKEKKFRES